MNLHFLAVVVTLTLVGSAVPASAQNERGWIDVNFGIALPAVKTSNAFVETRVFQETARFEADYRWGMGADFDFGGGFMFTPIVGVGASFTGTAHVNPATVSAHVPHPTRFALFGDDTAETDSDLTRAEGGLHIHAMLSTFVNNRFRVRFFVGPSFFRVTQDTIDDVRYNQVFNLLGVNQITITGAPFSKSEATAWGFHFGSDFAVFFNRIVGMGGLHSI